MTPSSDELAGVATVPPGTMPSEAAAEISLLDTEAGLLGGAEPGRAGAGGSLGKEVGVFMGEGLPPVPGRLVDRIRRWEYIEMCELLPELLPLAPEKLEGPATTLIFLGIEMDTRAMSLRLPAEKLT